MSHRKHRDGRFKARVALEAIKNQQIIIQIAGEYGVNPSSERITSAVEIHTRHRNQVKRFESQVTRIRMS